MGRSRPNWADRAMCLGAWLSKSSQSTSGLRSRSREEVSSAKLPRNESSHWTKPNFLPAKTGRNRRPIQLNSIKRRVRKETPPIWDTAEMGDGNETAFNHHRISSTLLRSDFSFDEVDASNAPFRCRWGRLEMQHVGVHSNHLRAQPRCPLYIDELTSSGRHGMSERRERLSWENVVGSTPTRGGQADFRARESRVPQRASVDVRARLGILDCQIWQSSRGRAWQRRGRCQEDRAYVARR
jgi:hypothetical protein